jgi:hypothetical protein
MPKVRPRDDRPPPELVSAVRCPCLTILAPFRFTPEPFVKIEVAQRARPCDACREEMLELSFSFSCRPNQPNFPRPPMIAASSTSGSAILRPCSTS